jgi:N-acetyl-anhydromuramyl-L-alanine amidase AmpD
MIRVGQVLRIPPLDSLPAEPPPPPKPKPLPEPTIEFMQSPHYNQRPPGAKIRAIVVHATANSSLEGVIRWFTDPTSFLSAHYNIGKDGRIVQMVQDDLRAWHAGKSVWKGVHNVNDYSLGIELVNQNDGQDPYPAAQYQALVTLCARLIARYSIQVEDIVGHKDISLSGKTDPAGLNLERLRQDLRQLLT